MKEHEYKWVPREVVTSSGQYVSKEPDWQHLPQMPYMEFYNVSLLNPDLHIHLCMTPTCHLTFAHALVSAPSEGRLLTKQWPWEVVMQGSTYFLCC